MPWMECDRMSQREEFVLLADREGTTLAELCRRFGISRKTGYKWLGRYASCGRPGLRDRSRRPQHSPDRTPPDVERLVLQLRQQHPTWGGRKLRARLLMLGHQAVPSASTITAILHRHGEIDPETSRQRQAIRRFEREHPNDLWQMDFKGDFALGDRRRCHPLTVLDDHSRYSIGLRACANQRYETVREQLTSMFRIHGLPRQMLMDNGTPWGVTHGVGGGYTRLTAWLLRLDVRVSHGRPYHPQTQGKEERFHRTLKQELLREQWFADLDHAQRGFDPWRRMYNHERPHEALDMGVPAHRYRPSERRMPESLPPQEYESPVVTRRVSSAGQVQFQGRVVKVSEAFAGGRIGLRETMVHGVYEILWDRYTVGQADLNTARRGGRASVRLRSLRSLHRTDADSEEDGKL